MTVFIDGKGNESRRRRKTPIDWGRERQALYRRPETDPARRLLLAYQSQRKAFDDAPWAEDTELRLAALDGVNEMIRLRREVGILAGMLHRRIERHNAQLDRMVESQARRDADIRRLNDLLNEFQRGEFGTVLDLQRQSYRQTIELLRAELRQARSMAGDTQPTITSNPNKETQ